MMNNTAGVGGSGSAGQTITPNTLSAITGVLNNGNNGTTGSNGSAYAHQGQENNPSYLASANNAANTAANGLFLLSQAHQELTKREEAQARQSGGQQNQQPAQQNGKRGTKRKVTQFDSSDQVNGTIDLRPKRGARNTRGRKTSMSTQDDEDDEDMESDDGGDGAGGADDSAGGPRRGKKPETEEEKRKNFLERNRQGMYLSCYNHSAHSNPP